jgi:hypothetical protein
MIYGGVGRICNPLLSPGTIKSLNNVTNQTVFFDDECAGEEKWIWICRSWTHGAKATVGKRNQISRAKREKSISVRAAATIINTPGRTVFTPVFEVPGRWPSEPLLGISASRWRVDAHARIQEKAKRLRLLPGASSGANSDTQSAATH